MNEYVEISKNLYVVKQAIKSKSVKKMVKKKVNHIWIYDRSYSMSYELPNMINQLVNLSKNLPKGDTLTLGYFSSEGQYNFIIKGFKISDNSDYNVLENIIRNNEDPLGCTCFSEIINETDVVINDLSAFSDVFSFAFFTDGYPVVSSYTKEINNIFSGIEKIKGKLTTAQFIGYSYYYNKPLMTQMAQKIGGMLIHNNEIDEFSTTITKLINLSELAEPKIEVKPIVSNPVSVFMVTKQGVVLHEIENDKLQVSTNGGNVYYITKEKKPGWKKIDIDDIDFSDCDDATKNLGNALYASILVLTQNMKNNKALEVAGKIGDVNIIDSITNAFTITEYGNAEKMIDECINGCSNRYSKGKNLNYLPPKNAYCVFELLNDDLMNDSEAKFFPYDSRFKYNKISKSIPLAEGYSNFIANKDFGVKFSSLVFHKSRLNLSVRTQPVGTVKLLPKYDENNNIIHPNDLGLLEDYPCSVYRNFSFVSDSVCNFKVFYVTTSKDLYKKLKNKGLVVDDTYSLNGIYGIDISNLPIMNREIAEGNRNGIELCENVFEEIKLKSAIKVYNHYLKKDFSETYEAKTMSEKMIKFLEDNGIKDGIYNPKKDSSVVTGDDYYMAKSFEIKVKSFSSIPKIDAVIKKTDSKKKLTPSMELLKPHIDNYLGLSDDVDKKEWLENKVKDLRLKLYPIRSKIQKCKMALILGNSTIEEFKSKDDDTLVVNGNTFKFEFKNSKVKI